MNVAAAILVLNRKYKSVIAGYLLMDFKRMHSHCYKSRHLQLSASLRPPCLMKTIRDHQNYSG